MTIDGYTYDGWTIQQHYRPDAADDPAPLRRSPRHVDLIAALDSGRQVRTKSVFRRVLDKMEGVKK